MTPECESIQASMNEQQAIINTCNAADAQLYAARCRDWSDLSEAQRSLDIAVRTNDTAGIQFWTTAVNYYQRSYDSSNAAWSDNLAQRNAAQEQYNTLSQRFTALGCGV